MHDLAPFVQFKKREKHPWRAVTFSKVAVAFWPTTGEAEFSQPWGLRTIVFFFLLLLEKTSDKNSWKLTETISWPLLPRIRQTRIFLVNFFLLLDFHCYAKFQKKTMNWFQEKLVLYVRTYGRKEMQTSMIS